MTYREYFELHQMENVGWCTPYTDKNEENYLIMYDGTPESVFFGDETGGVAYHRGLDSNYDAHLEKFARLVNPYYDQYVHRNDDVIARDVMHETGCYYCPFKNDCDAMWDNIEK